MSVSYTHLDVYKRQEHNIAIESSDHLVGLMKAVYPDSEISKKLSCNRTKCTAIIKNVIAKTEFEELLDVMRNNNFSILVDESTDRSSNKHLAVVVRRCLNNHDVRDDFFMSFACCRWNCRGPLQIVNRFF